MTRATTLADIAAAVEAVTGVTLQEMRSRRRSASLADARAAFCLLAHSRTDASYPEIAGYLGRRNHSTAKTAADRLMETQSGNGMFLKVVDRLNDAMAGEHGRLSAATRIADAVTAEVGARLDAEVAQIKRGLRKRVYETARKALEGHQKANHSPLEKG